MRFDQSLTMVNSCVSSMTTKQEWLVLIGCMETDGNWENPDGNAAIMAENRLQKWERKETEVEMR